MGEIAADFVWYIGIMGTGLYVFSISIGAKTALPKTFVWQFLWGFQLLLGLSMTMFPFLHIWIRSH